jgi:hypothetical protein
VAVGCTALKPHFLIVPLVVLLLTRRWRAVAGAIFAGATQTLIVVAILGFDVFAHYAAAVLRVLQHTELFEPKLWQAHGIKNALDLWFGHGIIASSLYLVAIPLVLYPVARTWRRFGDPALKFSLLLLATVLLNPHMYGYDLVITAPAMLLLANRAVTEGKGGAASNLGPWLVAAYLAPLAAPLAAVTRVQGTVFVFAGLGWIVWSLARVDPPCSDIAEQVSEEEGRRTVH